MRCAACTFDNSAEMRFCGGCGRPLAEGSESERRQLTVMFCDLVGWTSLSERLDPEELRDVLRAYQSRAAEAVARVDGHVAQYLGDGILAYFGYPRAHEDDARRAVYAGLGIVRALEQLNQELSSRGIQLTARLGLHSGRVVMGGGPDPSREGLALGQTPNVAARIEGIAIPGTVAMSAATWELVRSHFEAESLGVKALKGVSTPLEIYQVLRERDPSSEVRASTPMVGREAEFERLLEAFGRSTLGPGSALLIEGEGGIGKSRLLSSLREKIRHEPHTWIVCSCSAFDAGSPLNPIISMLSRTFGIAPGSDPGFARERLEAALDVFGPSAARRLPVFAELLSVPLGDDVSPLDLSPEKQRQETVAAVLSLVTRWRDAQPLVFVIEDLQWADPSTHHFVSLLVEAAPASGVLVLLTARPSDDARLHSLGVSRLPLAHLSADAVAELAAHQAGGKALPREMLEQIAARTDGIPLFAEELTRTILASDVVLEGEEAFEVTGDLSGLELPSTLQGWLTARLDGLRSGKEVAQLGAVLGREFDYELLSAVSPLDGDSLRSELDALAEAGILLQSGEPPHARFAFQHSLIQEAAYAMMLKRRRREHHTAVAHALAEHFPDRVERQPELVARNYTEGGHAELAVGFWLQAGERALKSSATVEAANHLQAGLSLLEAIDPTRERDERELSLQIALGNAYIATRGFVAPEVASAYTRASELSERVGDRPEQFWAIMGLFVYHLVRGELDQTIRIAEQLLELGRASGDPGLLASAESALGTSYLYLGDFERALGWFERAIADAPPDDHSLRDNLGVDLRVSSHGFAGLCLWHLGAPGRSLEHAQRAIELARKSEHAFSLAHALVFGGTQLHQLRRDPQAVATHAQELVALCEQRGFPVWHLQGIVFGGWAALHDTSAESPEGVGALCERMVETLEIYRGTGSKLAVPYLSSLWAEGLETLGRGHEATPLLDEAIELLESSQDRMWEAELHRMRGRLILARDGGATRDAGAETCFLRALEVARRQGSRALELRAAMSLGRLWREQGRSVEAQDLVARACRGFREGSDTEELREAHAWMTSLD